MSAGRLSVAFFAIRTAQNRANAPDDPTTASVSKTLASILHETRFEWRPPRGTDAASIDVTFPHRRALKYLGFVVSRRGGPDAHVQQQLGIARRVVERMESEYGGCAVVTFNQALLMWTIHGRVHVGWPAAVLPPPLDAGHERPSSLHVRSPRARSAKSCALRGDNRGRPANAGRSAVRLSRGPWFALPPGHSRP